MLPCEDSKTLSVCLSVPREKKSPLLIVKPKQIGSCGRGIRNEYMSNTNTILTYTAMEQIQFIYFQDYMQYYTVHHKENSTYM